MHYTTVDDEPADETCDCADHRTQPQAEARRRHLCELLDQDWDSA